MTYKTIEQVEGYINDVLLKSANFDLEIGHYVNSRYFKKKSVYYYERNKDQRIFHLIFVHDGSDAGNNYNQLTLDFLENFYQNVVNLTNFDVIESLKDSFVKISKDILEKTENFRAEEKFDNSNKNLIKLSKPNDIILKKCFFDELGYFNLKGNGFEPTYNCYKKGNKIIIKVEIPGNKIISSEYFLGYNNIIRISGEKKKDIEPKDNNDLIFSNREFGKFYLDIPLKEEFRIKDKDPTITEKRGLIIFEFEIEEQKKMIFDDDDI
jgi:HSP20 family molecular chaperone IbpA